jgi:poly(3-hydroxybutyrate) depolymerase
MSKPALSIFVALVASLPLEVFAQGWETRTLGGTSVHVYVPSTIGTRGSGRGLVVGLHGCTQSNTLIRDAGNWEPAADRWGVVVALPIVPNGGVIAGCWDYYGENQGRMTRHAPALLTITESLVADPSLSIDRAQVYIAGFSSGGGQAAVMGCLAPDVYAGVGIAAGPAVGTEAFEASQVATDAATVKAVCERFAGGNAGAFATQVSSIIHGTNDFIVAPGYARVGFDALALVYGTTLGRALVESSFDVTRLEGYQPMGQGAIFSDASGPRISLIVAQDMGHAFPAGSGPGPERSYVASEGVAWPSYLAAFFTENNRRVSGSPAPDSGIDLPDAAVMRADALAADATARADGGTLAGGDDAQSETGGGCSCAANRTSGTWSSTVVIVLVFVLRRSLRHSLVS